MKPVILLLALAVSACSSTKPPASSPESPKEPPRAAEMLTPSKQPADPLKDLAAVTFPCPRAGLNAAAREASKEKALGSYQFAYFSLISDSHHSMYEVHFKSNHYEDPELRYCVSVSCQPGWTPEASVTKISGQAPSKARTGPYPANCGAAKSHGEKHR